MDENFNRDSILFVDFVFYDYLNKYSYILIIHKIALYKWEILFLGNLFLFHIE